ncbi:phage head closure protein [Serratia marcescens]|uniref:phage head closure protein n=1 Tax=Serratia TaxID=613 RepID=UPI001CDD7822|nr:phage head closure protein [Serratia marcescens]MCA4113374.1 phage head closure protein [Serratia marcescens]MDN0031159.1 phage head closure protein [Serratia marcescens]BEN55254.1 head-tail adaptor protein [Serratia marcescens]
MQAGKLRHRITLQKPVKVQDTTSGEMIDTWQDVSNLWAEVSPLSAREFVAAQAMQNAVTTRIKIRYRQDIEPKYRILFLGKIFNIEGILSDPKSGLEYLTLPCSEGTNDG